MSRAGNDEHPIPGSVCVVGAGAVGGLVGGCAARAGADVTLVDRGERLEALREDGLTLISPDGGRAEVTGVRVARDTSEVGSCDLIVLAVKTYDLPDAARSIPPLIGPETVVLALQNGIPWWYFHEQGGRFEGRRLRSLDPEGVIGEHLDPDRVLGCVAYVAAEVSEPGVVRHREGKWFPLGEPDGTVSGRARAVAAFLERAGFRSKVLEDIRSEIWLKAWGSLSFNPISALTGATLAEIGRHPDTRDVVRGMMEEAKEVCGELGISVRRSIEDRIAGAEAVGDHETSMLQDLRAGRELEIEGLVGSVLELAALTDTPAPRIRAVYALTKLLERQRGGRDRRQTSRERSDAGAEG